MPRKHSTATRLQVISFLRQNMELPKDQKWTYDEIAKETNTSKGYISKVKSSLSDSVRSQIEKDILPPIRYEQLDAEPRKALEDFRYFRTRYFDRDTPNFQLEVAERITKQEPTDSYIYLWPPGFGKTTCVSTDLPIWRMLQARAHDERFACLLISKSDRMGRAFVHRIKKVLETNQKLQEDFGWFKPESPDSWAQNQILVDGFDPEKQGKEPTFIGAGAGSHIYGWRVDMAILDDVVDNETARSVEKNEQLAEWVHEIVESRLEDEGTIALVGCLAADSRVLMADGTWKPIVDVEPGETVVSYDESTEDFCAKLVEAMIPQGTAEVLEVRTGSQTIRATGHHPFLVVRDGVLKWLRADELSTDDLAVTSKNVEVSGEPPGWMDEGFAWFAGFLLGDGWVGKSYVCCAMGTDESLNDRVKSLFEEWFHKHFFETPFRYLRCNSKEIADGFRELGLGGGAKTKRVPDWVFRAPIEFRREFLRGVCDADGHHQEKSTDSYRVELSNEGLVHDLYLLALTCGVRPGRLRHRTREVQPPNSPEPVVSTSWDVMFNFAWADRSENGHSQRYVAGEGWPAEDVAERLTPHIRLTRVKGVEPVGEEPVYDLTVADTHNFVSEGFVVHNTRFAYMDLYGLLLRKEDEDGNPFYEPVTYRAHDENKCPGPDGPHTEYPDGCLLWPQRKRATYKALNRTRARMGSRRFDFVYNQIETPDTDAVFQKDWIDACKDHDRTLWRPGINAPDVPRGCRFVATLDPSPTQWACAQVWAFDPDDEMWYLTAIHRDKMSSPDYLTLMRSWQNEANNLGLYMTWVFEVNATQKWLLESNEYKQIRIDTGLRVYEHTTGRNKLDPDYGVQAMAPLYEYEKVSLPWRTPDDRKQLGFFIEELMTYPEGPTDDGVMAAWFAFANQRLFKKKGRLGVVGGRSVGSYFAQKSGVRRVG